MPKPKNHTITLKTYEDGTQKYIDDTRSEVIGEFKTHIDNALAKINKNANILEIGTATGRDADYIESKGYTVTRTDIVEGFLDYQRQQDKCKFQARHHHGHGITTHAPQTAQANGWASKESSV